MASHQYRTKWFWAIVLANGAVCVLLLALLYGILSALSRFAAGIESWALAASGGLLALGVALSIVSPPIAKVAPKRLNRYLGYGVNGGALVIYLVLLAGVAFVWVQTSRRLFLVPAGFQGDLYLVHDSNAMQRNPLWRTTYSFPSDGVLETPRQNPQMFSDKYEYIHSDGHTQELKDAGPGTLQDTPENRSNTSEVVTYFGRTAQPNGPNDCYVEEISIGTRAFLLARHHTGAPPNVTHPGICHPTTH